MKVMQVCPASICNQLQRKCASKEKPENSQHAAAPDRSGNTSANGHAICQYDERIKIQSSRRPGLQNHEPNSLQGEQDYGDAYGL